MADEDRKQGANFIPGNKYIAAEDLRAHRQRNGGRYLVVERQGGKNGREALTAAAQRTASEHRRLFGFFGGKSGHLPYATADGDFNPTIGVRRLAEVYSAADLEENPTLADLSQAGADGPGGQRQRILADDRGRRRGLGKPRQQSGQFRGQPCSAATRRSMPSFSGSNSMAFGMNRP